MRPFRFLPLLLAVSLSSICSPVRADELRLPALPAETVHLANGLRVFLAPDPHARLVSVHVVYNAGAADDPDGRSQLAHIVEHLLSTHLEHVDAPLQMLASAGACHMNAQTRHDDTNYFETVPPERLETVLWLEGERMGFGAAAISQERLEAERRIVKNEIRDRTIDGQLANVWKLASRELFPAWHPYSEASDDYVNLQAITVEDARAFVRTWYTPANATLAIAGRFDRSQTLAWVERYFASLPSADPPHRPALREWVTPSVRLGVEALTGNDVVTLYWRTPAFGTKSDLALDLAATALDDRLSRTLVAARLASNLAVRQRSERRDSLFVVGANVESGVSFADVILAAQSAIDDLGRAASAEEVLRARRLRRRAEESALETSWGRASRLVVMAKVGLEPASGYDWGLGRYDGVTDLDVRSAVTASLAAAHRVTVTTVATTNGVTRGRIISRVEGRP